MTYCPTWFAVERATGSIINNSGKFEDRVLMIAERQTYSASEVTTLRRYTNLFIIIIIFLTLGRYVPEGV